MINVPCSPFLLDICGNQARLSGQLEGSLPSTGINLLCPECFNRKPEYKMALSFPVIILL